MARRTVGSNCHEALGPTTGRVGEEGRARPSRLQRTPASGDVHHNSIWHMPELAADVPEHRRGRYRGRAAAHQLSPWPQNLQNMAPEQRRTPIYHLKWRGLQRRVVGGIVTILSPRQLIQPLTRAISRDATQIHGDGLVDNLELTVCLGVERRAHAELNAGEFE